MANMSNYLENKLIDFLFRAGSFTPPATIYAALCTAVPTDTSTGSTITEVSGGNYARVGITSSTSNWKSTQGDTATSSGTGGTTSNGGTITWVSVTWAATVTAIALCDASSAGNVLFWGALSVSKSVTSGDSVSFVIGDLTCQIDN